MESVKSAALPGTILQLKVRRLGISPMIWRRVLVPESVSLRELHGVVQLAMGWEGIGPYLPARTSSSNFHNTGPSPRPTDEFCGPNRFGLHRLRGSVMEWLDEPGSRCFSKAFDASRQDDRKVLRGPSGCNHPRSCHRSLRAPEFRWVRDECFGFRVARVSGTGRGTERR